MGVNIIFQVSKRTLGNCSTKGIASIFSYFLILGLVPLGSESYSIISAASLAERCA